MARNRESAAHKVIDAGFEIDHRLARYLDPSNVGAGLQRDDRVSIEGNIRTYRGRRSGRWQGSQRIRHHGNSRSNGSCESSIAPRLGARRAVNQNSRRAHLAIARSQRIFGISGIDEDRSAVRHRDLTMVVSDQGIPARRVQEKDGAVAEGLHPQGEGLRGVGRHAIGGRDGER